MLMKKMLAIILVSLVLSGCEKNGSQNDLIINNTEEENVVMDQLLPMDIPPSRHRIEHIFPRFLLKYQNKL